MDYLIWEGRMGRKPYILLSSAIFIFYLFFNPLDDATSPILSYLGYILIYFKYVWNAQRLHDIDLSGFWSLILIPVTMAIRAGSIISFVGWISNFIFWGGLLFIKGTDGENEYGPDPLAPTITETNENTAAE